VSSPSDAGRGARATSAVDHLLLGVGDLDHGIAWLEKMTGVRAVVGGSHPGVGTRNAVVSFGGRRYLEIMAPDPDQADYKFRIDVRNLSQPRLITWAAGTTDIDAVAKRALEAGVETFGPHEGARARPDGRLLRWKTLGVMNEFGSSGVEPIPFFIEWARDSLHPSQDSPKGCALRAFEIEHPSSAGVTDLLAKLGIETQVKTGESVRLTATLRTPKGDVQLR
jgi:hypothetical protein